MLSSPLVSSTLLVILNYQYGSLEFSTQITKENVSRRPKHFDLLSNSRNEMSHIYIYIYYIHVIISIL